MIKMLNIRCIPRPLQHTQCLLCQHYRFSALGPTTSGGDNFGVPNTQQEQGMSTKHGHATKARGTLRSHQRNYIKIIPSEIYLCISGGAAHSLVVCQE